MLFRSQSIAYLQNCDISFLVAPMRLEDFDIGSYLTDLYGNQITGKIPSGLILYDNNSPSKVSLVYGVNVISENLKKNRVPEVDRFWAKHQDLPIPL